MLAYNGWEWNGNVWVLMKPTTVVRINKNEDNFDTYIGRGGHNYDGFFGNPFKDGTREDNIARFKLLFPKLLERVDYKRRLVALTGHKLGCFCKPLACHGDVLAEYLNARGPYGFGTLNVER